MPHTHRRVICQHEVKPPASTIQNQGFASILLLVSVKPSEYSLQPSNSAQLLCFQNLERPLRSLEYGLRPKCFHHDGVQPDCVPDPCQGARPLQSSQAAVTLTVNPWADDALISTCRVVAQGSPVRLQTSTSGVISSGISRAKNVSCRIRTELVPMFVCGECSKQQPWQAQVRCVSPIQTCALNNDPTRVMSLGTLSNRSPRQQQQALKRLLELEFVS